jgi:hypothetical protein
MAAVRGGNSVLGATTSSAPCLRGVGIAKVVVMRLTNIVLLASIASEPAIGVGSAVCRMAEGTWLVEGGNQTKRDDSSRIDAERRAVAVVRVEGRGRGRGRGRTRGSKTRTRGGGA